MSAGRGQSITPLHPDTVRRLGHHGVGCPPFGASPVFESYDVHVMRQEMVAGTSQACGPGPGAVFVRDLEPAELALPARLYRPSGEGAYPAVVALHGGGWVSGNIDTHDAVWRRMASAGLAVVALDYPLAPESPYPVAVLAIEAAASRLHRLADDRVTSERIGFVGDSAGGNLAAVLANRSSGSGLPVAAQVLVYPVIDARMDSPSYREFGAGYGLTAQKMTFYWDHYCPDEATRTHPDVAPAEATTDVLAVAPPTLVITAECDVLRDEGEQYAQRLADAGATAIAVRYRGVSHGFFRMLATFTAGAPAADQAAQFLRERLQDVPS